MSLRSYSTGSLGLLDLETGKTGILLCSQRVKVQQNSKNLLLSKYVKISFIAAKITLMSVRYRTFSILSLSLKEP